MSRREALKALKFPGPARVHRGLWLDKFLESSSRSDTESKRKLVEEVAEKGDPEGYAQFFERYRKALEEVGAEVRHARTRGRLVLGLGGEGVLETALTLHRTYGVPYIPGSALKGLASRYAHLYLEGEAWRRDLARFRRGEAQAALFGTTEEQGLVVFFDALPLPGTWALWPDILNPHHPRYYSGENKPPADWDSPVPVPFLSATGTFLVALSPVPGVTREEAKPWLEAAWRILAWALAEEGVGAKTSSGYGRMALEGVAVGEEPSPSSGGPSVRSAEYEHLVVQVRSLSYRALPDFLVKNLEALRRMTDEERDALRAALDERGLLRNPRDLKDQAKRNPRLREALELLGL